MRPLSARCFSLARMTESTMESCNRQEPIHTLINIIIINFVISGMFCLCRLSERGWRERHQVKMH